MVRAGQEFEEHSWSTIRRNYPLNVGWELHGEQFTLPSGKRPDYVLWNEYTEEFAIIECKDVTNLTATHIDQALGYAYEIAADNVEVFIASDTEVSYGAQELAEEEDVYIRRLRWRAAPSGERPLHPLVVVAGLALLGYLVSRVLGGPNYITPGHSPSI